MTRAEIISGIHGAIEILHRPLLAQDRTNGWTDERRMEILRYFKNLDIDLENNRDVPFFSLIRVLDGMGISEGDLLEELCRVNNAVNRM